jgi:hypothetical protein
VRLSNQEQIGTHNATCGVKERTRVGVGVGGNSRVNTTFQEVGTIITKVFEGSKVKEVQINIRTNPCCRQADVHIIDDLIVSV